MTTPATLTTLVSFNETDGYGPLGALVADANGDLFGVTSNGGDDGLGAVFEVVKTASSYASTPIVLASFDDSTGWSPNGLVMDAEGDLFGTTQTGGADNDGTVFEIVKMASGYASAPTVLANFDGANGRDPRDNLYIDANGDLFGTTEIGGVVNDGTVFEIAKTASGYGGGLVTLANMPRASQPEGALIADAAGDIFGTTSGYSTSNYGDDGGVFEIAKTAVGYSSTPTFLATFDGADGELPLSGLVADSEGDLFGATYRGGAYNDGGVFEIAKTASGYASAPTVLLSFDGTDGKEPYAALTVDAAGDLLGSTFYGGADDDGVLFEIAKTAAGYASAPSILVSFDGDDGSVPSGVLLSDGAGDLAGVTAGGGAYGPSPGYGEYGGYGTVFELGSLEFNRPNDILYLSGANTLTLTGGSQKFVFQADIGQDVIGGFTSSDVVLLSSQDFSNFAALSSHISQFGANAEISGPNGGEITLLGVSAASLSSSQFHFV